MHILVAAAGAVGAVIASFLQDRHDVYLIARGAHLSAVRENGLRVIFPEGDSIIEPGENISDNPQGWGQMDLVILAVKSYSTDHMLDFIAPCVGPETKILSVQNGIGNEDKIAEKYGLAKTIGGRIIIGAELLEPGVVQCYNFDGIVLGPWDVSPPSSLENLVEELSTQGMSVRLSEDIRWVKWRKLLWNAAFNPITAITKRTVEEVLADPDGRELAITLLEETRAVAEAMGYKMPEDVVEKSMQYSDVYRGFKTSMQQDVKFGRKLEYEAITGEIIRAAREKGVDVPANEAVYATLRMMSGD